VSASLIVTSLQYAVGDDDVRFAVRVGLDTEWKVWSACVEGGLDAGWEATPEAALAKLAASARRLADLLDATIGAAAATTEAAPEPTSSLPQTTPTNGSDDR
jgi:hypothetical protein